MSVLISIILILASLVLIISVLMQEGNKQGLGAIGGAAETFLGKNKAKSYEGKLLKITRIVAVVFVVLALLATFLSSRTFSVKYYTEDGKEYFPYLDSIYAYQSLLNGSTYDYDSAYANELANSGVSEKDFQETLRSYTTYKKGEDITKYSAPSKEGYTGTWALAKLVKQTVTDENGKSTTVQVPEKIEGEVPTTMGSSGIALIADYTINSYTITIIDDGVPAETEVAAAEEEAADAEAPAEAEAEVSEETAEAEPAEEEHVHNVIFTYTANYGEAIDYAGADKLPEEAGYITFFSTLEDAVEQDAVYNTPLPETIPAQDVTFYVCYAKGNYVTYWVETNETEEVEEPVLDEEGNETKDEEGNVITQKVTKTKTDEEGNAVTKLTEWFPKLSSDLANQLTSDWQNAYADLMNEDYMSYLEAYINAISEGGEITSAMSVYYSAYVEQYTEDDRLDVIRMFVKEGEALPDIGAPTKDGMVGVWEPEVTVMGTEQIDLIAKYYPEATLTIYDDGLNGEKVNAPAEETPAEEPAEESAEAPAEEAKEETSEEPATEASEETAEEVKHNVIFTYSGEGRTINYGGLELPEAPEGYTVKWSVDELPETVPAGDTEIFVIYEEITAEGTGNADEAASENE